MSNPAKPDDTAHKVETDPLLALRGSGKDLWSDEHADEYVRRLREGDSDPGQPKDEPAPNPPAGGSE
jgi:hypothetical protein